MSKAKGSRWERDFVAQCDELGLPARRVPLSGAMEHYPGDVEVCDEVLVECKYRTGTGFVDLYDLPLGVADGVRVEGNGVTLWVRTLEQWGRMMRGRMDGISPDGLDVAVVETRCQYKTLLGWVKGCQYIAVRMPRREWLVVEVLER